MRKRRSEIVDLDITPFYHCVARCVRKAFLCGYDKLSKRNYDHRKVWIVERIKFLATYFAINVCSYAVLDNHFHVVLRVLADLVDEWTDAEVIRRAGLICPSTVIGIENWSYGERKYFAATWRERLVSISWFMGRLDDHIARKANKEDASTGKFWEARFKSQALMDEGALLASMAYVDLNPIRAGMASGLDDSAFTSIQQRLREAASMFHKDKLLSSEQILEVVSLVHSEGQDTVPSSPELESSANQTELPLLKTLDFEGMSEPRLEQCPTLEPMAPDSHPDSLPLDLFQYMELLEWTGRAVRDDKRGAITGPPSQLIQKCGLDPEKWLESIERFGSLGGFVGHPNEVKRRASRLDRRWLKGQGRASSMSYTGERNFLSEKSSSYREAA